MKKVSLTLASVALLLGVAGCMNQHTVRMEPVQIQPIVVTMDVNVRIERTGGDEAAPEIEEGQVPEADSAVGPAASVPGDR